MASACPRSDVAPPLLSFRHVNTFGDPSTQPDMALKGRISVLSLCKKTRDLR